MEHYPFVNCLNPIRIKNPATGEDMVVPCGHCKACTLQKNQRLALQCNLESQCNKYCLFITLTYANRFIPRASLYESEVIDSEHSQYTLVDDKTGEILHEFITTPEKANALLKKFYLFDYVPYLKKTDLQKWFKRLRKEISKFSKDKIRYFAVGEYGPVHFRPHYHILLWFEDKNIMQICSEIIYKTWPYGRVDCQLSSGKASDYVASYVNSSCTIPELLKGNELRPFCVHSRFLGRKFFKTTREEVYKLSARDFISKGAVFNGKYVSFKLWAACYSVYYPKCQDYTSRTDEELYYSYTIYDKVRMKFRNAISTFDLAKDIFLWFSHSKWDGYFELSSNARDDFFKQAGFTEVDKELFSYFSVYWQYGASHFKDIQDRVVRNIYKDLLVSKHFIEFCCNGSNDFYTRMEMIYKIKRFYSELDYMRLTDALQAQQMYLESDLIPKEDLCFFYDNVDTNRSIKECNIYQVFADAKLRMFDNKIKHKKLNDANKLFFD